jgi:hypothetical protein
MTAATMDGGSMKLTILSKYTNFSAEKIGKKGEYDRKLTNVFITPDPAKDPELHPELLDTPEGEDKAEQYKFYMSDDSTEEVFNYKLPRELIKQIKASKFGPDLDAFNVYLVLKKEI